MEKIEKNKWKKIFWEKYEKHINEGKCQFWGANGLCHRPAKEECECFVCESPCCYICYKNFIQLHPRNTRDCLFCHSHDDVDFKYFVKIYFDEKGNQK
ncbi:MAG: hypothetical protein SPLM_09500 [Spiroplasma phoeniceum]|uniref:hypothetical protein n=1 Tax=Spiroplasma phoeniceum TaxID=47835 RepID=UPI00313418E7